MRYRRFLSPAFRDLLLPSGQLAFLIRDYRNWIGGDRFAMDVQLREHDAVMLYHGTTKLLTVELVRGNALRLTAERLYADLASAQGLFEHNWSIGDCAQLSERLPDYLHAASLIAANGAYRNRGEGFWQNRLAMSFGCDWQPGMDWLIIDREAVIGFDNTAERDSIQVPIQTRYGSIRLALQNEDQTRWGVPSDTKFGNELDFLALGPDRELVLIELKDGANNASGVYWGRLQVAVYRDIFQAAINDPATNFASSIRKMVLQKIELGLLPRGAEARLPTENFRAVQSYVAVANPSEKSAAWQLSRIVLDSCPEANATLVDIRSIADPAPVVRIV